MPITYEIYNCRICEDGLSDDDGNGDDENGEEESSEEESTQPYFLPREACSRVDTFEIRTSSSPVTGFLVSSGRHRCCLALHASIC